MLGSTKHSNWQGKCRAREGGAKNGQEQETRHAYACAERNAIASEGAGSPRSAHEKGANESRHKRKKAADTSKGARQARGPDNAAGKCPTKLPKAETKRATGRRTCCYCHVRRDFSNGRHGSSCALTCV